MAKSIKFPRIDTTGIHPKRIHALIAPSVYEFIGVSDPKASRVGGRLPHLKLGKGKTIKAIIVSDGGVVNQIRDNIDHQAVYNNREGKMAIIPTTKLVTLKTCSPQHKDGIHMCQWGDISRSLPNMVFDMRKPAGREAAAAIIAKLSGKK